MRRTLSAKQIGNRLRELRLESGLSVIKVGKKLGVFRQHIYDIESGRKNLTVKRLQQFADLFNVKPEKIIGPNGNGQKAS